MYIFLIVNLNLISQKTSYHKSSVNYNPSKYFVSKKNYNNVRLFPCFVDLKSAFEKKNWSKCLQFIYESTTHKYSELIWTTESFITERGARKKCSRILEFITSIHFL